MTEPTATETTTIKRGVTLSRTEQDCYMLEIELPEGVTVEQVDAELIDRGEFGKYAHHRSCYAWDTGTMACGAIVKSIDENRDDCPELDCGPIVRDAESLDLVKGSAEWPGHFWPGLHLETHHKALITIKNSDDLKLHLTLIERLAQRFAQEVVGEMEDLGNPEQLNRTEAAALVMRAARAALIDEPATGEAVDLAGNLFATTFDNHLAKTAAGFANRPEERKRRGFGYGRKVATEPKEVQ